MAKDDTKHRMTVRVVIDSSVTDYERDCEWSEDDRHRVRGISRKLAATMRVLFASP